MESDTSRQQVTSIQNTLQEKIANSSVSNQKGFIPLMLGVLILLVIVAGGAYYLGTQKNKPAGSSSVESNQSTTAPTGSTQYNAPTTNPSSTSDTLTNWKLYTSIKANYSFKYPSEWPLVNVPTSPQCTVCVEDIQFTPSYNPNSGDSTIAVILVFKEENIKSLDDYVNIHVKGDQSKVDLKYTTVGGERAVSYKLSGGIPPLPVIEYAVYKNGFYYVIRIDDSPETNKNKERNVILFDEMLTTFSFTN